MVAGISLPFSCPWKRLPGSFWSPPCLSAALLFMYELIYQIPKHPPADALHLWFVSFRTGFMSRKQLEDRHVTSMTRCTHWMCQLCRLWVHWWCIFTPQDTWQGDTYSMDAWELRHIFSLRYSVYLKIHIWDTLQFRLKMCLFPLSSSDHKSVSRSDVCGWLLIKCQLCEVQSI